MTTALLGELLLGAILLGVVTNRGWWQLAGLIHPQPLRQTLHQWRTAGLTLLAALALMVIRVLAGLRAAPGQRMLTHTSAGVAVALLLAVMLLVGFNEELTYRGLALGALLRARGSTRPGVYQAVIITSVLFGLGHLIRGGPILQRLELAAGTATIGMVFAAVRLRSGSIWVGATLHALGDSVQFVGALSVGYFAAEIAHNPPWWVAIPATLLALLCSIALIEAHLHQQGDHHGEGVRW